ncbi:MAG: hypothetical protein HKO79_12500, partial [Desulfobacterales bacterium]|nr:hypothetical protein [Desulfobacterales bacterium]
VKGDPDAGVEVYFAGAKEGETVSGAFKATNGFIINASGTMTGIQTTITDTDTQLCTSGAVVDYVGGQVHNRLHSMTDILSHTGTAWRLYYGSATGTPAELAFGADNTYLKSTGASSAPAFEALDIVDDTTPQLGGDLDLNGNNIDYGAILTVNGTYEGEIITVTVDDAGATFGAVLAQAADFNYDRADADAVASSVGLVMNLSVGSGSQDVLLQGQVCNIAWNWSAGFLYLDTAVPGGMTQTAPTGTGDQVVVLGWALSADTIMFRPSLVLVENA